MPQITAAMVKKLRDQSGAGMMDCKKALQEVDGDMESAMEALRKRGIAKAAKKASRATNQGTVGIKIGDGAAAIAEVSCETDFVARNEVFLEFVDGLLSRTVKDQTGDGDVTEAVRQAEDGPLSDLVGKIGENMIIARVERWESDGSFGSYIHMGGKIGVLVEVHGQADDEFLKDICMHIAAFRPQYITPDDIPDEVIAKEREIAAAQVQGKPDNIIEKIVDGKMGKWYSETCLTRQPWLRDDKTCLAKAAPNLVIDRFARWEVGELAAAEETESDEQ
ncbi:MAG: translation elongation factor Ts [Verrucomicrobiota bacterium]